MKTVLHITEAFGGGIQTAICSYAQSTKDLPVNHILLARWREKDDIQIQYSSLFHDVVKVKGHLGEFFSAARKALEQINPDIIHLHSSYAGFLCRFLPKQTHQKIIYTPHCYSFERRDISPFFRQLYFKLERLGLSHIDAIAGCSQRECDLAKELGAIQTMHLNNYAQLDDVFENNIPPVNPPFDVVTVGRVSPQKDPQFFLETAHLFKRMKSKVNVQFHWLGDGDKKHVKALKAAGIQVSGMLDHHTLLKRLSRAHLYIHTAAWEGMPLTMLEAAKMNIPLIIRIIGATQGMPYPFMVSTPTAMANQIINFARASKHTDYHNALSTFNSLFTQQMQRETLCKLYEVQ